MNDTNKDAKGLADWVRSRPGHYATPAGGAPLVEAYHVIFDAKDAHQDNDHIRNAAYRALSELADLMGLLGTPVPTRFDGEGRPA